MLARIHLFAIARQRAGRAVIEIDLPEASTVADLRSRLRDAVPDLASILPTARFAVDAEYAEDARPILPDSEIALIPPVSGGSRG